MTERESWLTVNSKRWWIRPARRKWHYRWNRWLMSHDPARQARIAAARAEYWETGDRQAMRRWLDVD